MREKPSISQVYEEVRAIRKMLEELSEKAILQGLASESVNKKKAKELDQIIEEVKQGKFVPLTKLKRG